MYFVFSQDPKSVPDTERLIAHAKRFFASDLTVVADGRAPDTHTGVAYGPPRRGVHLRLVSSNPPVAQDFWVVARDVSASDLHAARAAEARGRAGGMSALAEKCRQIWELLPPEGGAQPAESDYLLLAGICASVALGPVLPPDHSTLFGVRGAIERRDAIARGGGAAEPSAAPGPGPAREGTS